MLFYANLASIIVKSTERHDTKVNKKQRLLRKNHSFRAYIFYSCDKSIRNKDEAKTTIDNVVLIFCNNICRK